MVPGNLLVSRSVYENDPSLTAGVTELPAGCVAGCAPTWSAMLLRIGRRYQSEMAGHLGGLGRTHLRAVAVKLQRRTGV